MDPLVRFDRVTLNYRVFHERSQSLKATVINKLRRRDAFEIYPALKNVSFAVQPGEAVGIVGANGSGKSTLLKLVASILSPSAGSVAVQGRVAALLELGAGFSLDLTGAENVYLNASLLGLSRAETAARFREIVAFSELDHFIDSPIRHYSSGMYMRLGFAVAVHVDADLLLFDEVIAVGDQGFQRKCYEKILGFRERGRTIFVVSHSLDTLMRVCDRGLLLDQGMLVADGPMAEIARTYTETYSGKPFASA
jgi:ABC-2 type transport system ATP-binding protein